jgi:hypothetical protein
VERTSVISDLLGIIDKTFLDKLLIAVRNPIYNGFVIRSKVKTFMDNQDPAMAIEAYTNLHRRLPAELVLVCPPGRE